MINGNDVGSLRCPPAWSVAGELPACHGNEARGARGGRPYNNCLRVARTGSLVEPKAFRVMMIEHPHPFLVRLDSARAVVIQWLPVLSINSQTLMSGLS